MTVKPCSSFGLLRAPARLLFGTGQVRNLAPIAGEFGNHVLICTDERFTRTQAFADIEASMEDLGLTLRVFDQTQPELPLSSIINCQKQIEDFPADVIVGLGGGSCMDMAKLISLATCHGTDLSKFYGENLVPSEVTPVIAVPTTAGTGSEVTPVAVLADHSRDVKVGISSRHLIPKVAICDPNLTLSCPAGLTAVSGSDALTHAIEAYTAVRKPGAATIETTSVFVGKNQLSDAFALEAIRVMSRALPKVMIDANDISARSDMLFGSMLAGLAFGSAGTSAAHAIQYPIGAITHTPHGLGVSALMPYCMAYNRPKCKTEFAEIARILGATDGSDDRVADMAPQMVSDLFQTVGIPKTLDKLGAEPNDIAWIAEKSMGAKRLVDNNPRPLTETAVHHILHAGFNGDLALKREA